MILPYLDCALCGVSENSRAEGQVGRLLGIFECFAEFFTAFIVYDVKFKGVAICLEFEEKCLPTGCELCRLAGLDRIRENNIGIVVIKY